MEETNKFNAELFKMLCEENSEDENECLITSEPLDEDSIELVCKHRFNYKPLFSEISRQKIYNKLEVTHLKPREIKCPYCRTIQNGLIPPSTNYPELLKFGVNQPIKHVFKGNKCSSILKSGKRKGDKCNKSCYGKYCIYHNKKINTEEITLCDYVIKRGKRKGHPCSTKCSRENNIKYKKCSKHLKI